MKPKYIIFFIILIFFSIIIYIFNKNGNNIINQNQEMIIEKIFNLNEYKANAKVTVYSNKNQNQYEIEFKENLKENYSFEEVKGNKDFEGFSIELKNNKLTISNTNLNLRKIYKDYNPISKNYLFLSNFIKEANMEKIEDKDNQIIIVAKENENNYLHSKTLYINKEKNVIEKMVITDKEQNVKIIIEYTELQLN